MPCESWNARELRFCGIFADGEGISADDGPRRRWADGMCRRIPRPGGAVGLSIGLDGSWLVICTSAPASRLTYNNVPPTIHKETCPCRAPSLNIKLTTYKVTLPCVCLYTFCVSLARDALRQPLNARGAACQSISSTWNPGWSSATFGYLGTPPGLMSPASAAAPCPWASSAALKTGVAKPTGAETGAEAGAGATAETGVGAPPSGAEVLEGRGGGSAGASRGASFCRLDHSPLSRACSSPIIR
jgi:hypothetical protein